MALAGVSLFGGEVFKKRGGKGKVKQWAADEATKLRALPSHIIRLRGRTDASRHPMTKVLKGIVCMARPSEAQEHALLGGP